MPVYLNGSFVEMSDAKISVTDRGFLFGDGIYEVIRSVNGQLFREKEHLERLDEGLKAMSLDVDKKIRKKLPEIFRELIDRNNLMSGEGTIYFQITRGPAWPRTHTYPDPEVEPTVYVSAQPFTAETRLHKSGIKVIKLPDLRWARCNIKSINLLPNTMARQEAIEKGTNSAIMIRDGIVTESPNANIFGVRNNTLITHPATNYILRGITRGVVIEAAAELGIDIEFCGIREEEVQELDELFFSGTTTDIQPVIKIDEKPVGSGSPGPVVKKIQNAYRVLLYGEMLEQ